ncbi:hypothetical protein CJF32_00007259 [Rutstroemia sp. NJR-2017a WRK4]|nr:hypothetical protein CJF32_00007259 [Rutstroemia sp. NJR-2017a WRK4]
MDSIINKAKGAMSGSSGTATGPSTNQGNANTGTNAPGQDYGDKALDMLEKKTGHSMGAGTNEKITDGLRGAYEKQTGSKVDPKWSN